MCHTQKMIFSPLYFRKRKSSNLTSSSSLALLSFLVPLSPPSLIKLRGRMAQRRENTVAVTRRQKISKEVHLDYELGNTR